MNRKHLSLAIAALLAAGGLWFAWSAWRSDDVAFNRSTVGYKSSNGPKSSNRDTSAIGDRSSVVADGKTPDGEPKPGRRLRPPVPNRRFTDFTPEQRVEFARKGHGPGG